MWAGSLTATTTASPSRSSPPQNANSSTSTSSPPETKPDARSSPGPANTTPEESIPHPTTRPPQNRKKNNNQQHDPNQAAQTRCPDHEGKSKTQHTKRQTTLEPGPHSSTTRPHKPGVQTTRGNPKHNTQSAKLRLSQDRTHRQHTHTMSAALTVPLGPRAGRSGHGLALRAINVESLSPPLGLGQQNRAKQAGRLWSHGGFAAQWSTNQR